MATTLIAEEHKKKEMAAILIIGELWGREMELTLIIEEP